MSLNGRIEDSFQAVWSSRLCDVKLLQVNFRNHIKYYIRWKFIYKQLFCNNMVGIHSTSYILYYKSIKLYNSVNSSCKTNIIISIKIHTKHYARETF